MSFRTFLSAFLVLSVLGAVPVRAAPNDLRLWQLGNPNADGWNASPEANARFRSLALQLGSVISSPHFVPARSLGVAGFSTQLEYSVSALSSSVMMPTEAPFSGQLTSWNLHVRKGLPLSLEVGGRVGWIENSQMYVASAEAQYAFHEVIDFGARLHVSRLINTRDFGLTTVGSDLTLGKTFSIASTVTLSPYVGWNLVWVSATSNTVDFRPERTEEEASQFETAQIANTGTFQDVSFTNNNINRFLVGAFLKTHVLLLGLEWSTATPSRFRTNDVWVTPPNVDALSVSLGLQY